MDNLVLSNIFHRPARTLVSIFGISIGVLLIIFTVGLSNGSLRERGDREANVNAELLIRASGSLGLSGSDGLRLKVSQAEEIAKIEGVKFAVPVGQNNVEVKDSAGGSRLIEGVDFEQYASVTGVNIVDGRALGKNGDEAIVDLNWQIQKKIKIGDTTILYERPFTIVGSYDPVSSARVKIPLATMQEQLGSEGKCSAILVKLINPADEAAIAGKIEQAFPEKFQIIPTRELPELYLNSIPALGVFLDVLIGIAAAISGLVILLTMYTTVTERTRQIGILKSLGMSKAEIAWTIAQEALLLSFLGVLTGLILTVVLRYIVINTTTLQVAIEWEWIAITLAVALLGGALGALYPALRAANLDAVEALSYE